MRDSEQGFGGFWGAYLWISGSSTVRRNTTRPRWMRLAVAATSRRPMGLSPFKGGAGPWFTRLRVTGERRLDEGRGRGASEAGCCRDEAAVVQSRTCAEVHCLGAVGRGRDRACHAAREAIAAAADSPAIAHSTGPSRGAPRGRHSPVPEAACRGRRPVLLEPVDRVTGR